MAGEGLAVRNGVSQRFLLPPLKEVDCIDYPGDYGSRVLHSHRTFQLTAMIYGKMEYGFNDGSVVSLDPGDAIIIPPGCRHNWHLVDKTRTLQLMLLPLLTEEYGEIAKLFDNNAYDCRVLHLDADVISECWSKIERERTKFRPGTNVMISVYLLEFMVTALRQAVRDGYGKVGVNPGVQAAAGHIMRHYREKVTLEDLAGTAKLSVSRFSQLFRESFGMAPIEYLVDYRMERARMLLQSSEMRIGEIVQYLGLESISYFSRKFKEKYGCPPSGIRKDDSV